MVEPSNTPDVTFTVPGDLISRVKAAYDVHADSMVTCGQRFTAANNRAVAVAARALADVYDELAARFTGPFAIWHVFADKAVGLRSMATRHDNQATTLDMLSERGESS